MVLFNGEILKQIMKKLLITGASGYLGSRITKQLLNLGYSIIAVTPNENDVPEAHKNLTVCPLDQITPQQIFAKYEIEGVFHFATCYGRSGQTADQIAQVNLLLPLTLLSQAVKQGSKFFINTDTILQPNINPYSLTKRQFAQWLEFYADKIKAVNMRLDHFYGPHDHPVKFIAWLIKNFKENIDHIDLTEGAQTRDFIYIDDVISAYLCVFKSLDKLSMGKFNNFEVGSGVKTSIKDMVLMLQKLMNKQNVKLNFGAVPYRKNEVLDYTVDISALQSLGWFPKITLQKGLQDIIIQEKL